MTYRILVAGPSDWTDPEVIDQAISQAVHGHEDAVLVVGDSPAGVDAIASHAADVLGLPIEQHSADRDTLCWRCERHGVQDGCRHCEATSERIRNAAMIEAGANVCLLFLTARNRTATGLRFGHVRFTLLAQDAGIEVREYSTPERLAQKRRANRAKTQRRQHQIRANGPVESFTAYEIGERDDWVCGICQDSQRRVDPSRRSHDPLSPSIDHIVPVSSGGQHSRANVRISHLWCNVERNSGTWHSPEYMRASLAQILDGTPMPEDVYRRDRAALHARVATARKRCAPDSTAEAATSQSSPSAHSPEWAEREEYMIALQIAAGLLASDPEYGDPTTRLDPFIRRLGEQSVRAGINMMRTARIRRESKWRTKSESENRT